VPNLGDNAKLFHFLKSSVIKKFYPIIEDPSLHNTDFTFIKDNFPKFEQIRNLGHPFDKYILHFKRYIRRFIKESSSR